MDEEVSAIEWCSDTVDTRIYAVSYYSLEGKKKMQGKGISTRIFPGGLGNGWRRYLGYRSDKSTILPSLKV